MTSSGATEGAVPPIRVLVVEDNEMNRDMLTRRLARQGIESIVAVDGAQAIEVARQERPDLILMDLQLPVMTGLEATKVLKADPGTRAIPIVALTAQALEGDRDKGLAAGCDDYETKPIDLPRLVGKIRALVSRGR